MRRTAWLLLALCACEDDILMMQREDVGVRDSGAAMPLGLERGMTFDYRAQFSYRGQGAMNEANGVYEIQLVIQDVEDRGPGLSSVSVTGSGAILLDEDTTGTQFFDLWASRLGPLGTDQVGAAAVSTPLDGPPELPAAPSQASPKQLPAPDTFFLDLRDIEALRAAFDAAHAGRSPRVVAPAMNNGNWLFAYEGPDDSVFFFGDANKRRTVSLEYDPRGFLVLLSEDVGAEPPTAPHASARLELRTGP